jgi:hypothetical protein
MGFKLFSGYCLVMIGIGLAILLFALILSSIDHVSPFFLFGIGTFSFVSFFTGFLILLKSD